MEAGRYERELESEAWMQQWVKDKPEYISEFLSCLQGVEYTTRKEYMEHVWRYLTWLRDQGVDIEQVNNLENKALIRINQYLSYLKIGVPGKTKEITGSYRAVAWTALNHFYDFLVDCYNFKMNPVKKIARPISTKDKVDKDVLSEEEIQQIIHNIRDTNIPETSRWAYYHKMMSRDLFLFLLLIDTGARISGILELNMDDIRPSDYVVVITSKGHITKDYYVTEDTIRWFLIWKQDRRQFVKDSDNQAVFVDHKGKRWGYQSARSMLQKYSYNVNKHVTPHTTRRSIATLLYEETNDIELVKDKLGHASVSTTSRYIKKGNEHIKRANAIGAGVIARALE